MTDRYMISVYYATLLIVGNESAPQTIPQMVLSSTIVIIGSMFTAYIFGNMVEAMKALNKKQEAYSKAETTANSTMRAIKMPSEQQDKVLDYMEYMHNTPDVE